MFAKYTVSLIVISNTQWFLEDVDSICLVVMSARLLGLLSAVLCATVVLSDKHTRLTYDLLVFVLSWFYALFS